MKAVVVGVAWPDSFAYNIAAGLRELGCSVTAVEEVRPRVPGAPAAVLSELAFKSVSVDDAWQRRVCRRILAAEPDLVLSADARLAPSVVTRLRKAGCRTAFWFPDHVSNLGRMTMLAAGYDVVAFKDLLLVERLAATYTSNVRYLPEACNPSLHHPPPGVVPHRREIVVVGNLYQTRLQLLRRLHDSGIPLRLYGSGFPRWSSPGQLQSLYTGEHVTGLRKAEVFRSAAAVLNNLHPAEMNGVNARLFEAAGSGGLLLTEARPALAALFSSQEVVSFSTYDQLHEAAQAALHGDLPAREMGDRASSRAHAEHKYSDRLRLLLEWLL